MEPHFRCWGIGNVEGAFSCRWMRSREIFTKTFSSLPITSWIALWRSRYIYPSRLYPAFIFKREFQKKAMGQNLAGPARHFRTSQGRTEWRAASCSRVRKSGADRHCREFAAAAFAAFAASLLQAAAQVGGSSSKTYTLSVSYEVCSFGSIVTACGISILRHAAFIMFVDRGHRWTLVVTGRQHFAFIRPQSLFAEEEEVAVSTNCAGDHVRSEICSSEVEMLKNGSQQVLT